MAFEDVARRMQERDAKAVRIGSAYTEAAEQLIEAIEGQPRATWQSPLPSADPQALRRATVMLYAGLAVLLLSLFVVVAGEGADRTVTRLMIIPAIAGGVFWVRGMIRKHDLS